MTELKTLKDFQCLDCLGKGIHGVVSVFELRFEVIKHVKVLSERHHKSIINNSGDKIIHNLYGAMSKLIQFFNIEEWELCEE